MAFSSYYFLIYIDFLLWIGILCTWYSIEKLHRVYVQKKLSPLSPTSHSNGIFLCESNHCYQFLEDLPEKTCEFTNIYVYAHISFLLYRSSILYRLLGIWHFPIDIIAWRVLHFSAQRAAHFCYYCHFSLALTLGKKCLGPFWECLQTCPPLPVLQFLARGTLCPPSSGTCTIRIPLPGLPASDGEEWAIVATELSISPKNSWAEKGNGSSCKGVWGLFNNDMLVPGKEPRLTKPSQPYEINGIYTTRTKISNIKSAVLPA